jgi:hypothetical protein
MEMQVLLKNFLESFLPKWLTFLKIILNTESQWLHSIYWIFKILQTSLFKRSDYFYYNK